MDTKEGSLDVSAEPNTTGESEEPPSFWRMLSADFPMLGSMGGENGGVCARLLLDGWSYRRSRRSTCHRGGVLGC